MSLTTQRLPFSSRSERTTDSPISWLMKLAIEDPEMLSLAAGFVDVLVNGQFAIRNGNLSQQRFGRALRRR